jgi:hypothetical protein
MLANLHKCAAFKGDNEDKQLAFYKVVADGTWMLSGASRCARQPSHAKRTAASFAWGTACSMMKQLLSAVLLTGASMDYTSSSSLSLRWAAVDSSIG